MPDCTELQRAVDASIAIIDGLVSQLDGELMLLQDRLMALDECMMGGFAATAEDELLDIGHNLQLRLSQVTQMRASLLKDSGTQPGFDDGTPPGPAPAEGGAG